MAALTRTTGLTFSTANADAGATTRPQPAIQRAGESALGTAALFNYLTDELRAQLGLCGRWPTRNVRPFHFALLKFATGCRRMSAFGRRQLSWPAKIVVADRPCCLTLSSKPQTKSYLWSQMTDSGHPVRCFTYTPGRGAQLADKLFMGIRKGAVLMTDGYEPYNGIAERYQLVHLGCWVHCRRYFVKAEENVPKAARSRDLLATRVIKLIGKLFAAEARTAKWEANQRQRLRRRYSARVLDAIYDLMLEQSPGVVPNSLLGKALTYLREQWPKLILYVENGDWPISNNACENSIRPFVIGRRGWLFADTVDGAAASANLYSLVETCKACRIDPYRYLTLLFQQLPLAKNVDDYAALLPWSMSAQPG